MPTINRANLVAAVQRNTGLLPAESCTFVETVLKEITACLERGETVKLSSFGLFLVRKKSPRIGRNPKTGTETPIAARQVVLFKASAVMKRKLNGK